MILNLKTLTCQRCFYQWYPRFPKRAMLCPRCRSKNWWRKAYKNEKGEPLKWKWVKREVKRKPRAIPSATIPACVSLP